MKIKNTIAALLGASLLQGVSILPAFAEYEIKTTDGISFQSTGGVGGNGTICPKFPNDVIVPLDSLNPAPKEGEPEMTIDGIWEFMQANDITTMEQLLDVLPDHYRNYFSLVEVTRAAGQSTLEYPRIVLFGPDGRFMANVGTLREDPVYDKLDVTELNEETGHWELSVFDFTNPKPKLERNVKSCEECHGAIEPRPFWGTNLDWPGVFGDNIAEGPQGEAMDGPHAKRMNEIKNGKGNNPRFDFLVWRDENVKRGGKRRLAGHQFGADLFISNIAMGTATARGVFMRMQQNYPKRYEELKEIVLLLGYDMFNEGLLSPEDKQKIAYKMQFYGAEKATLDEALMLLGINTKEAFSLGTLAETETPITNWKMGGGTLYEAVLLQVLDDLSKTDEAMNAILDEAGPGPGVFRCPDLAQNMQDIIDFKMLHMFHLRGHARYMVHWVFYPADLEHINKTVLRPTLDTVAAHLKKKVLTNI